MKTFTIVYKNKFELSRFIDENHISHHHGEILVQVFTSKNQKKFILTLVESITSKLPNCKIIGTTTCGEICDSGMTEHSSVISFSLFDKTSIEIIFKNNISQPYTTGIEIAKKLIEKKDLKCAIAFSDGLHFNVDQIVKGINTVDGSIVLCGGIAGDNAKFHHSFIFTNDQISDNAIVIAGLYSTSLYIHTDYNFNWLSIGKTHTITSSDENRVFMIDDMTPIEFYKYYLGEDIEQFLPNIGIEFPLIIQNDDIPLGRAVLKKHDDGTLSFAGNLNVGTPIKFGYGDIEMILNHSKDIVNKINNHIPIETIFIYSCMARKTLLKKDINLELLPLNNLSTISGFFTYGEFLNYNNKNYVLNETMTILTLSEVKKTGIVNNSETNDVKVLHSDFIRKKALSTLIAQTSKELEELQNNLAKQVQIELEKSIEKDNLIKISSRQALLGEMIEMILHQWRQPLSTFALATSSLQLFKETGQLTDTMFDKNIDIMMNNVHFLNETINIFRDFYNTKKETKKTKPSVLIHKVSVLLTPMFKNFVSMLELQIIDNEWFEIDENELIQVLLNIIKNAIDEFKKNKIEQPKIKITINQIDSKLHINIEDNGGGIDEMILDKIFDKKFTTKKNQEGTGLGLAISKDIIEKNLGGKIFALNGTYGAIFKIKVPIK
ncbi:FIST N-terminal domain-containing protein [Arcobacter sp. FWKO B]|uniref:FIST N-terminal domain-containing protein n=1 Tax=Arcobacter sp. FWKO B TaxID=2593672 RepID=UPI0018A66BD1|nr:FIST N-terminal domain-containing protein [Arcobacter sp. FWKO B]QOG11668.1 GHKL domain-containing protein [Arcobacter sp. FWKO B]